MSPIAKEYRVKVQHHFGSYVSYHIPQITPNPQNMIVLY